ncbi:RagB/SusD family nutrient uptake outer membrane protein [Mucilaginibacter sp. X5P1]|uniref:RagB/SusD family nutrient uptake outer membrane protein n=1 Tax=Mucilaginibacter sp. X5P1 TaxID=2723088 RepID=UPI0016208FCA|nr:RagB/SusD family nutrient uptake outer membrane protein [Mucilaginibacter sp. X5P1]MBB6138693.1 hypothetical protein [Mucilaginibacter sp. X5P1]
MKNYKIILLILGAVSLVTACKKYETFPVAQITIDRVFDSRDSLGTNAYAFLQNVYATMLNGHNRVGGDYLDAATDDAVSSAASNSNQVTQLSTDAYNSGTFADAAGDNVWANYYSGIRQANIFIANIGVVPVEATLPNHPEISMKYAWKNEARFLRAYFYFELVKRYGGVPLLGDKVYNVTDNLALPRNTFSDCINYIVSECNAIKGDSILQAPYASTANYGRVTNAAVLALKAKALLYAASPLFNGTTLVKDAGTGQGPRNTTNAALVGYPSADPNRWQLAANAAQDVINLGVFSLDQNGFQDIFLTQNNPELIFIRQGDNGNNVENNNAPIGFPSAVAKGVTSPTQDLVNAFPMLSGLNINDPNGHYNPDSPYARRDPRLLFTVFVNGQLWLNTNLQLYQGGQSIPNSGVQQTVSGYYLHKFMGHSETLNGFAAHSEDWVIFRYAEILLDYAEAENEVAGPNAADYQVLKTIRARAGIAAGTDGNYGIQPVGSITQDSLRSAIHNERRLEFAFEEQRFFDLRRWKVAAAYMNQARMGLQLVSNNQLTYNYVPILPAIFKVNSFTPKQYLQPIPYGEVVKNPQMQQNPGW